ncbi:hypothetical protein AB6E39_20060 [Vibrio splendidus]|uniref:hypothetical protein n=1 Tax=Vibrio splendidus TaxID=29497 RepID=UPI001E659DAD|nr:hypothetical protein [Vibrio splendidus]MCC4790092.1 hypothetical protein [Vibrio splendidus]
MKIRQKICSSCDCVTEQQFILGSVNHVMYFVSLIILFLFSCLFGSTGLVIFVISGLLVLLVWASQNSQSAKEKSGYWSCCSCGNKAAFKLTQKDFDRMIETYTHLVSNSHEVSPVHIERLRKVNAGEHVPISEIKMAIKSLEEN